MSGPPHLEKRVSLRTQQRLLAAAPTGNSDADREALMRQAEEIARHQAEMSGTTDDGHYQDEEPEDQSAPPPPASRLHRHQSDYSMTSQVEAVTALSELFQPHQTQPPPMQISPTPLTPAHTGGLMSPTPLQHQQSFYASQPFLPSFTPTAQSAQHMPMPSLQHGQSIPQLMSPTSGISPQHLFHPSLMLHHHLNSGQFLSPPPALSPMGGYRSFHLSPPAIPGANPGAPLHAASATSHLSPYHSTRLPILHDWFFANRRAHPPRGPMELPAPDFDPVDLNQGTAAFVDSLRAVLRGNAHDLPRCLPLEDLTSTPQLINALQFSRYARRSAARKRRVTRLPGSIKHVSRQLHAARRVRGKGGRFLTKEEKEQMARDAERNAELGLGAGGEIDEDIEPEAEED